jgi:hypothetical protein
MRRIYRSLAVLIGSGILLLLTGCNTISMRSAAYLSSPNFPPTEPSSIEILQTAPTKPHVRLGEITAEPSGNPTKQEIQEKFQVAAAKMGANAVVIVSDRTQIMGGFVTGGWYDRQIMPVEGRVITGVAIRYTQPAPAQAAP